MLKHVTPAHPKASIPDLDRGGFLPAEGRTVTWSAYWAGLAAREDVTVSEPPADPKPTDPVEGEPAEGEPNAPAGEGAPAGEAAPAT